MAEDPLDVLRDCVQNHRQMKEVNGKICLGSRCYPKNLSTKFPIKQLKGDKKGSKGGKFYSLQEIFYFVQNHTLSHIEYTRRAQEQNIKCVLRPDRKRLLIRIFGGLKLKTRSSSEKQSYVKAAAFATPVSARDSSSGASENVDIDSRKLQTNSGSEKQKPHVRTYSRKRSAQESRRHTMVDEDKTVNGNLSVLDTNLPDELTTVKSNNLILEGALKSMVSFLKDHLGVTADQVELIQNSDSNTVELSNIATQVKNNIVHASVLSLRNLSSQINLNTSKQCYKAVKHPIRGWEMRKQKLSSVLQGEDDLEETTKLEEEKSASIENYLAKGALLLKRAFSVLISQMREYNKSNDDCDTFCHKVVKDCLVEAVDSFRDLFSEVILSGEIESESATVEKWVDVSRAELGKLFHSLVMTLQSLRDIATSQQKPPMSLFHLPEPIFSMALNPAKVTHSVVLEMYVRFGLAEMRQILLFILGCGQDRIETEFLSDVLNGKSNTSHVKGTVEIPIEMELEAHQESTSSPPLIFNLLHKNAEQEDDKNTPASSSLSSSTQSPFVFEDELVQRNNESRSYFDPKKSIYQTRRASESDYRQYSMFKTSIGNTLVSSFKKQIQEKIQASNFLPGFYTISPPK